MIDKYLAWLNVNIQLLEEQKSDRRKSHLQKRKARYKSQILQKARDVYKEVKDVD